MQSIGGPLNENNETSLQSKAAKWLVDKTRGESDRVLSASLTALRTFFLPSNFKI